MINFTEEDIKFICEMLLAPMGKEISEMIEQHDEAEFKCFEKIINTSADAINEIRYEQERDRRFYKAMFTQSFNIDEEVYNNFYKSWCDEFDKLNKEKFFK